VNLQESPKTVIEFARAQHLEPQHVQSVLVSDGLKMAAEDHDYVKSIAAGARQLQNAENTSADIERIRPIIVATAARTAQRLKAALDEADGLCCLGSEHAALDELRAIFVNVQLAIDQLKKIVSKPGSQPQP